MVERGPYVSYANCGLPYFIGGVIEQQSSLLVATADTFRDMFNVDARTDCEVVGIDAAGQDGAAQGPHDRRGDHRARTTSSCSRPGAAPIRPPLPGIDLPGIFGVRTVPDAGQIRAWIDERRGRPSGMDTYTGIPDAQAGAARGRRRRRLHRHRDGREPGRPRLRGHAAAARRPDHGVRSTPRWRATWSVTSDKHGVQVVLDAACVRRSGRRRTDRSRCSPRPDEVYPADIVILGIGVQPGDRARGDGRHRGRRARRHPRRRPDAHQRPGHLRGRRDLRDDGVRHRRTHSRCRSPARPTARAASLPTTSLGRKSKYRGTQGTAILGFFGHTAAMTGLSSKRL